jgi:putative thioredoxin
MAHVQDISTAQFPTEVLERSRHVPVVVDFWAEWCGPCKVLGPTLERLATEGQGSWELAKVDVDQNQQLAQQFGVQGIPTVVAFKDGAPVAQFTGALSEAQVREFVDQLVPSELDLLASSGEAALESGDDAAAERTFRDVLGQDPTHESAGLGLAGLLLEKEDRAAAIDVLSRLPRSEAVRRLEAYARLSDTSGQDLAALAQTAESGDSVALIAYGRGLSAASRYPEALEALIEVVARKDDNSEEARLIVLDLFELLGPDHPVTIEHRRRLASALF